MALFVLSNANLAYGHVDLLANTAFSLEEGERVGLIGRNGAGKSSLLKVIAEIEKLDSGLIQKQQQIRITYVAQEPIFVSSATVFETVALGMENIKRLREEYESLSMQEWTDQIGSQMDLLYTQIDAQQGWAWEQQITEVLQKLHLDSNLQISELSGGNKKRVALAQALVTQPDVLLLDEPTNHLDMDSIEWLEQFLISMNRALIFITHDRAFLDQVATRIIELDRGMIRSYPGNFQSYLDLKEKQLIDESLANARADKLLAQEEVWIRQGVEARRTRSVGRIARLEVLREQRSARRELVGQVKLDIHAGQRTGKIVASLENVCFSFGEKRIVNDFTATILRGDKVGILGPNGAGKSTLLKIILGQLQAQSGEVRQGSMIDIAYFDQLREALDLESSLEDFISPGSEWVEIGGQRKHVKSYLNDFLFSPERARSPVKTLSGGERNRLLLARLFAKPANVLVLDEPTNDLDIDTLDLLEEFLQNYGGTVFLVSHDRQFLDHVVTSMIAFEGAGTWREYEGGYEDWKIQNQRRLAYLGASQKVITNPAKSRSNQPSPTNKLAEGSSGLNKYEKKELDKLVLQIEALEREQSDLSAQLSDAQLYMNRPTEAQALQERATQVSETLNQLLVRWETLLQRQEQAWQ
ncbi:MAG: ATP-binding cassette domain-containing protein [Betaproteobacteria bacterium]|nr:ATP-binding cassette domain-containing protein [Betaproteobacteria bacterium]